MLRIFVIVALDSMKVKRVVFVTNLAACLKTQAMFV